MWNLFQHYKGQHYLELGTFLHSESLESYTAYLCLYPNPKSPLWIRPQQMFLEEISRGLKRFQPLLRLRKANPEDMETILAFGFDAWNDGRDLATFLTSYKTYLPHLSGQRYVLETMDSKMVCGVNTLRLGQNVIGLASLATAPQQRKNGYASLILKAVMALLRHENYGTKFLLFSEINPKFYEKMGFEALPEEKQKFLPSLAMGQSHDRFSDHEMNYMANYF